MIRHVVLARFKTGYDAAEVQRLQDGFRALDCPGTMRYTVGTDAGLREGNWDFAIVADFKDAAAFRGYDEDAAHGELRSRLGLLVEQIARMQFEIPQS